MRHVLIVLVALLSVAGYLITSETIRSDRRSAATRRAEIESVRIQALLDRARAYVVGLGNILAQQPVAGSQRFAELVDSTAGSAGLVDALWVQSVPASGRGSYERRLGAPITQVTGSGGFTHAAPAASYLPTSYTTGTRAELRSGVDVSRWPALASAIRNLATVFAVTASSRASLGNDSGFYLLESSSFGSGRDSSGYLAVFVPSGWLILSLADDPRQVSLSLDGRPLVGRLQSAPMAGASFQALARTWGVAVVAPPASGLQSLLPWLALGWPIAVALVAFLVGNAVVRRRRAEREVERMFDLSLDMLGTAGLDGYFKQVNPAFERILGYSREQLLARPLFELLHPEDVGRTRAALESLRRGHQLVEFENRYIRSDGSVRWLEWNVRPAPAEGVVYAAGRDVTDRRRTDEEQAALRRVATLAARGVPPEEVFAAVTEEIGQLLPVDNAGMGRYERDGTFTLVASWGRAVDFFPVGSRWVVGGKNIGTIVYETCRPVRIDSYADASGAAGLAARETGLHSSVGTPIIVEDRLWGVVGAGSSGDQPLPADTESRLAQFTDLLATAIANTESRAGLARLAEEQAALRRVATVVARGEPPKEVFGAVVEEIGPLLNVDSTIMGRYEAGHAVTFVGGWSRIHALVSALVGSRWILGGENVSTLVADSGRAARVEDYGGSSDALDVAIRETGIRSSAGTPLVVEGRLWGVVIAGSALGIPLPADTEARLGSFTDLLATAIGNAESRAALAASRARIVAAADETRRRIERDLHDGIQQRLVSLGLELRAAQATVPRRLGELGGELSRVAEGLASVFDELREISRGIHPAILSERGLGPALRALARRSPVPVELDLHSERRLPEHVEVAAYYVVSEALTNAAKHAHASVVRLELGEDEAILRLAIRDDGIGGADPGGGSGLMGLSDRIEALGGRLDLTSPAGSGTALLIQIPVEKERAAVSHEP
ncbi:MAG TPA: GAF domain-containing protein [Solirubrobacteraceae bacterium]|jgi:PAS domain S-box-containing protein|nr:GAF domain-containing protein [Solirubrobacteraceae bacterium]